MKNIFKSYYSMNFGRKAAMAIVIIFTIIVIFDSVILKFRSYTSFELQTYWNVAIFVGFSLGFSFISSFMISKTAKFDHNLVQQRWIKYLHIFIIASQIATFGFIVAIIVQMAIYHKYHIIFLRLESYLAYATSLIFIFTLSLTFIRWLRSKRNYIAYLFLISFLLLGANMIVSFVYLDMYFSNPTNENVRPHNLITFLTGFRVLNLTQNISLVFDILSTLSFTFMWIATLILLSQYSRKVGKVKYVILMTIPLLYYLFPLEGYFGSTFRNFIYGSQFPTIYLVIFSATTQIGAFIFSLSFYVAANLVRNDSVRHYTLISFIGLAIVFGSLEIGTLQYAVYPPFGLITQAFLPLGSYLLFIGIRTSALYVSKDRNLRREFYNSANSELGLLKEIGVIQMENDLMNKYKSVMKVSKSSERKPDEERDRISVALEDVLKTMDKDDVREILHEVLLDVYYKTLKKEEQS